MLTTISNARRRALVVTVVASCVLLVSRASGGAANVRDTSRHTIAGDTNAPNDGTYAVDDTAKIHGRLRRAINDFQDLWRKTWEHLEPHRHDPMNLTEIRGWAVERSGAINAPIVVGLRTQNDLTPSLRRYLATLCIIESLSDVEIEAFKSGSIIKGAKLNDAPLVLGTLYTMSGVSWATQKQIVPRPTFGNTCPVWTPPDEGVPPDEGESIDLALQEDLRAPMRRSRDSLILKLDSARARYPSDTWIVGQHFRFVYDQASPERSLAAA